MNVPIPEYPPLPVPSLIPPETTAIEAALYAAKKAFPNTAKKFGVWRPLIVAALGYLGWDSHRGYQHHEHRIRHAEEVASKVESFVVSPPTNGRLLHELPIPTDPNTNIIRRK